MTRVYAKLIPKLLAAEEETSLRNVQLHQPLYSSEIAPRDFLLFPRLKMLFKDYRFDNKDTVETNTSGTLKAIPKTEF